MTDGVDEAKIDILLTRGVENIYPDKEEVKERLLSGPQTIYLGIDPTGPSLHMGHAIILRKLRDLQKLGHKIILLIGDFTAMIGDPSGKDEVRKSLTREEVLKNAETYKEQAALFLDFEGENAVELRHNSEWLDSLTFEDVVEAAHHLTVQELLKRDMFRRRVDNERPIYLHEFLYPLMQGYDAVAMNVDGEIGGNDQVFNMLVGRTLLKQMKEKDKFVIGMKLLVDPTGKKMGKSEGNMVTLTDEPQEMFGKVMSWTDEMIVPGFELCTDISTKEIQQITDSLESGENPRDIKMRLGREIVATYHGEERAEQAQEEFISTFKEGGIPDDIETVSITSGTELGDILNDNDVVPSKNQFRRLVDDGAITNMDTDKKITDYNYKIEKPLTVKVGKRRFLKIEVE
ncbi:MAG: tyrosine--tRNA ligase [Candidatus Paceibacterota bacterium]